ncbi:ribonuclease Z [Flavicella sediminum]|uniref:ribonuclease Z n=1 Tax=Flavicella sediminum TaxID=2585141 RepID=UPI0011219A98|nr:ribonuclease Z [Flavicella sediminum]
MKYAKKETYTIVTPTETSFSAFFEALTKELETLKKDHLFIDFLNSFSVSIEELEGFSEISATHKEQGFSFVIVAEGIDIDALEDETLSIVPTLGEAEDTLEMDNIERDLLGL